MERSEAKVTLNLGHTPIWVIYVANPMSPEYDEDVYCENREAVDLYLGQRFQTGLDEFVHDDLTGTYVLRRPINGFDLRVNKRPLWRAKR